MSLAVRKACRAASCLSEPALKNLRVPSQAGARPPPFWVSTQWRLRQFSTSVADVPTTDATFRYRSFEWETSCGDRWQYEYVVAQQPAGGATARTDALSALEEKLPRPVSGWSVVLIPSVSLVCSGKEEVRPLAAALAQRGHRCYVLEWPGWTTDAQTNWALARCKAEHLAAEYEDFWCQALEQVGLEEANENAALAGEHDSAPRLCLVAAGHAAVYALRALRSLQAWRASEGDGSAETAPQCDAASAYSSLVMLAPTWQTQRQLGIWGCLSAPRGSRILGEWLHGDSRLARIIQGRHMSKRTFRRHFAHSEHGTEHANAVAQWLFQRPRPYIVTDAAVMYGLLDPPEVTAEALAKDAESCGTQLDGGVLVLSPSKDTGTLPAEEILSALSKENCPVEHMQVSSSSLLPHEVSPAAVQVALEAWLARGVTHEVRDSDASPKTS